MEPWTDTVIPALPGRAPAVRVYDTATRELRPLAPGPTVHMYVCGITPYDATHLGHAATYLTFDTLNRVLRDSGHRVDYVQNVTDIDEPLLERADRDGEEWGVLADRQTRLFRDDMTALRILPPRSYIGAVESIPEVVELVSKLVGNGSAYWLDADVYFSVAAAPRLGEISHLTHAQMVAFAAERGGDPARIGKKDPLDPVLWRGARAGEPSWESSLGRGRPGWHIECVAIALNRLGPTLDVQGGGSDLVFPHHELCAAQAEAVTGVWPFARSYVHQAMVGFEGEKMSKSRGNLVFVSALRADGVEPAAIRLALLAQHYREDWEWSSAQLAVATTRLGRWRDAVNRSRGPAAEGLLGEVRDRLSDDLRTPAALGCIDRWVDQSLHENGRDSEAPSQVRDLIDALLGVVL